MLRSKSLSDAVQTEMSGPAGSPAAPPAPPPAPPGPTGPLEPPVPTCSLEDPPRGAMIAAPPVSPITTHVRSAVTSPPHALVAPTVTRPAAISREFPDTATTNIDASRGEWGSGAPIVSGSCHAPGAYERRMNWKDIIPGLRSGVPTRLPSLWYARPKSSQNRRHPWGRLASGPMCDLEREPPTSVSRHQAPDAGTCPRDCCGERTP
jgi:hypothetical protein